MNEQSWKYIRIFFSRIWLIMGFSLASGAITYYAYTSSFQPVYEGKMKMMVTISDNYQSSVSIFDSLRTSQMAVGDVSQIATSEEVLAYVEQKCGISQQTILKALTINAIPNSRIIEIGVKFNSPQLAQQIIGALDISLISKMRKLENGITYKILNKPYSNNTPINGNGYIIYTLAAIFGGVILSGLINIILGETRLMSESLESITVLLKNENVLPVPSTKKIKGQGAAV